MTEQQPEPAPTVVLADNVVVMPKPGRKRPDYTHRPSGAWAWLVIVAAVAAYETFGVWANVEHTLSRTVWWLLGPEYGARWWLLGLPLAGLTLWTGPHFLFPHWFGGRELVYVVVALFVAGCFGAVATMGTR